MTGTKSVIIRVIILLLAILLLLAYIGPLITVGELNLGNIFGYCVAGLVAVYSAFMNKINTKIVQLWSQKRGRVGVSIVCALLMLGLVYFGTLFGMIANYSKTDSARSQVVVVLGCKVVGEKPGVFLRQRINTAYNYLQDNPDAVAVLCGGQGSDENISEGQCMYNALVDMGVSQQRLYVENQSTSTQENFMFARQLLDKQGITAKEITVVTHDFHQFRASLYAKKYGFVTHSMPAKTPRSGYITFVTREIFAVTAMILK